MLATVLPPFSLSHRSVESVAPKASDPCDEASLRAQDCKAADERWQRSLSRRWVSPDPLLAHLGVRYLQFGGDIWNRCHEGWMNVDMAFGAEGLKDYQIGEPCCGWYHDIL